MSAAAPGSGRRPPPPDAPARERVASALEVNLLVEAGAGSGKTTALVDRTLRLVASGTESMERVAAVTFTRKAAGELRQRVQERLEEALRTGSLERPDGGPPRPATPAELARVRAALHDLDRAFMGTIHAFCARLLRERPLEARLDPGFRELTQPEAEALARTFWQAHLERMAADPEGSLLLGELDAIGIRPSQLFEHFREMNEASDVEFPLEGVAPPDPAELALLRSRLEAILEQALPHIPRTRPAGDWDWAQKKLRWAEYLRRVSGFGRREVLLRVVADLCRSGEAKRTLNRWLCPREQVNEICARLNDLIQVTPENPSPLGRRLAAQWQAYCYGPVLRLVRGAAEAFAEHRRRSGQLTFHDLLVLATRLLRASPSARAALGARYRRVLVDEFQDTDPLQAELLFLLASEPVAGAPWLDLVPRPGALFVVGDPKQSIYRFRRADIALYGAVRERFQAFGEVVRLDANFRSVPAIGALVAGVFGGPGGLFPERATPAQAAFAPLLTQPAPEAPESAGVFRYDVPQEAKNLRDASEWEAAALAAWIAGRVGSGERRPEDFLVLTRKKAHLAVYARALEAWGVPVVVSGSGVGIDEELAELRTLLEALVDPDDPVKTVAALEGLFFGLGPEQLLEHRERGGRFDFRGAGRLTGAAAEGAVAEALRQMEGWWEDARRSPADEVVERIVESVGLLPWAAASELGTIRAGALAFSLDLIRTSASGQDASLAGALAALSLLLDAPDGEVESPLEPGRAGSVRLMNLHKAKGLEAPVVVLALPSERTREGGKLIVERGEDGLSRGWCAVAESKGYGSWLTLAAPSDWPARQRRESEFARAEEDRLLYVAVTRAEQELVVARRAAGGEGAWSKLDPWLLREATPLALASVSAPARLELGQPVEALRAEEEAALEARRRQGAAGFAFETVTGVVRGRGSDAAGAAPGAPAGEEAEEGESAGRAALGWAQSPADSAGPGGYQWGNAVHQVLEAAMNGLAGASLRRAARTALLENDRPVEQGEPVELDALLALVERVRTSAPWARAQAASARLTEVPFVLERENGAFLEGVIDLAFREPEGWVIVDYKTAADRRAFEQRREQYERQVALYGEAWTALTGEPVTEALLLWVG